MTLTTSQLAADFMAGLVAQGLVLADEAGAAALMADQLTAWLGGADAIPADLSYNLMQAIGAINTDALQRLEWWAGTATGGPNGDGLYPMTNAAGVTTLFPSLAKILQATAKGDPGGVSYFFAAATADADPGAGKVRFNHVTLAAVTKLFYDNASATGGDLTGWFASFGASSSAVKGLLVLQAGSTAPPLVFRVSGAPVARVGYYEIPVAYVAGPAVLADGASLTSVFMHTGDKGDSVRSGVGMPGAGFGVNGDVYIRLDTGDWYGPKTAGAWGAPIAQTEVTSLLAQAVAARDTALGARDVAVTAAGAAEDAAEAAIEARDVAIDKAGEASTDRQAVADDKAAIASWLGTFATDKAEFEVWLDQLAIDQPLVMAAAAAALAQANRAKDEADRAEAMADSVDGPLIAAHLEKIEQAAWRAQRSR